MLNLCPFNKEIGSGNGFSNVMQSCDREEDDPDSLPTRGHILGPDV